MTQSRRRNTIGVLALLLIGLSVFMLERERAALEISHLGIGTTPATLYQTPESTGPVVVVAHGFAGSRQIMQAYSLRLARAGYRVLAFDFRGHGRNPIPMSGDVTAIDGTTALLFAETRRAITAARSLPNTNQIALLGHSMATDVIIRASLAEAQAGAPVDAVIAISMYSQAVTASHPSRLLVISGQWEGFLRRAALAAVHQVDPTATEGALARSGQVTRRAIVAPLVEHVGVLFSPTAVDEAQAWLDATFNRQGTGKAHHMGLWILALLGGIVAGFQPLTARLPQRPQAPEVSTRRFLIATITPTLAAPLLIAPVYTNFLPVLVADYLMLHLALFGILQLGLLRGWHARRGGFSLVALVALVIWGIAVFGLALDRYAASFWPTPERLIIIAALAVGTVPFMIGDSYITQAGRGALWRRVMARALLFVSLGIAALLRPDDLTFVLIVLPVFLLFFLVHGRMGRWIARRSGATTAGLGLGFCLAWALGVSFPLFA